MLHVVTVHYGSDRWVAIQAAYFRRHLAVPYETWASLERVPPGAERFFDHVIESHGFHAEKLNHLALEICQCADDDDLLMFIDSDAFPIADPLPLIQRGLAQAPLLAVRRSENGGEPQPHPCFCVTTVGFWRRLGGDWSVGPTWDVGGGDRRSDVGAQLWRRLELANMPWVDVLRSNGTNRDPLYFGVYGDVIYHHGAGSRSKDRMGLLEPAHRVSAPSAVAWRSPGLRSVASSINKLRWRAWRRRTERQVANESALIYDAIRADDQSWLMKVR